MASYRYKVLGRTAAAFLAALGLAGCGGLGRYLGHISVGEAKILLSMQPLEAALKDAHWTPEQRRAIAWIHRAARDAGPLLGLQVNDNQYRYVARLDPQFRLWVLTVAEPDRLEAVTWTFPLVGEVPYLGFFDREFAQQLAAVRYPGKDHSLRTAAAFSTLGYLPEPILPELLSYPPDVLVNTVVHELLHANIYVPGQADFNETVATALGDAGAELLLNAWGAHEHVVAARKRRQDRQQWAALVDAALARLTAAYAGQDPAARAVAKQEGLEAFRRDVLNATWHNPAYLAVRTREINHAYLLAQRTYAANPTRQAEWYAAALKNFSQTLTALRARAENGSDLWAPLEH